jgi:hypothetical protein
VLLGRLLEKQLFTFNADSSGSYADFVRLCDDLKERGFAIEKLRFPGYNGVLLNAVLLHHPTSPWLLNFHMGKNNSINSCVDFLRAYSNVGSVFICEPQGFGQSPGVPTAESFVADGLAARAFLLQRGYSEKQIIPCGDSLGSGCATKEALNSGAPAVILSAAFSSLLLMFRGIAKFLWLYPDWMFPQSLHMNNLKNLASMTKPVLIMHGVQDEFINFSHAETLFAGACGPATLVRLNSGHRNTAGNDPETFKAAVSNFIASLPEP